MLFVNEQQRFGPILLALRSSLRSQAFEAFHPLIDSYMWQDDLERRKRAVLTALCDTVLTTNAEFAITVSNESADKLFKRSMLHEFFTDYLKDGAEKELVLREAFKIIE